MRLLKKKAIELFRLHWKSIGKEGVNGKKSKWFIKQNENPLNDCYLCEYTHCQFPTLDVPEICRFCPIEWPDIFGTEATAYCENSFYDIWKNLPFGKIKNNLALSISKLPEKKRNR